MYRRIFTFGLQEMLFNRWGATPQQWCRVVMDDTTKTMVEQLDVANLAALEISGNKWSQFGFKSYRSASFPEFDICRDVLEESFDLIIAEQVFEHLLWPYRAGRNVHRMLSQGGHFLITTPFLLKIHDHPQDCSRWTETGLKHLLAECGFELDHIQTGSWGNLECVVSNLNNWTAYNRKSYQSLRNEPDFPIVVWALAQK